MTFPSRLLHQSLSSVHEIWSVKNGFPAPLLWPHCVAGAILIFSISFRELIGSVLLRPPGMQTVSTFILREFDQGSSATGMAMGVIAIFVSLLSISLARRLAPKIV